MKRSDIDLFAKNTLENYTMTPRDGTWQRISDELDDVAYSKKRNSFRVSMGILLLGLLCGIQFTDDNVTTTTVITIEKSANPLSGPVDSKNEEVQTVALVKQSPFLNKKSKSVVNTKAEKGGNAADHPKGKTSENLFYNSVSVTDMDKNQEASKMELLLEEPAISSVKEVTEAELELLLNRARTNIKRERSLTEIPKSNAHMMLAEIQSEAELPVQQRFFHDVKQGFVKLKTVLAN